MAGKGPPKTATAILKARGSWLAKLPDRANEPQSLPEADMACPHELTDLAAEAWNRTIVPLFAYGIITVADRDSAIMLCRYWRQYMQACECLEADGYELETPQGPVTNPAWKRMCEASDRYNRLAPQFGIQPANRSRITNAITKRPAEDQAKDKSRFFKAG